jgi:5-methylcytosine-specific restriction endonuclease McrA
MKRSLIELTFYETYYFADIVKNVLENPSEGHNLHDFYGDDRCLNYISPFPRFSALHTFIRFVIDNVISEDGDHIKLDLLQDELAQSQDPDALDPHPSKLPVNLAMERLDIQHQPFHGWLQQNGRTFLDARKQDVFDYYDHLRNEGQFHQLLDRATAEVFFLLFQNRDVLLLFNDMISAEVLRTANQVIDDPEASARFARPGVLRRVPIPSWTRRAVYFRDRGFCVFCQQDLSGVVSIGSAENYDHVVPLGRGGLNDVTNLQLLCVACNSKKRMGEPMTSSHYEAWYEMKE